MAVKDFKEEIIKNNQLVIRWDFIMESHETKYKVWVEKEYMKMFVISNELTKEKHDLEEFLNKKYAEYKAQKKHNVLLKDLTNMLSEGYRIYKFEIERHRKPMVYQVVLTDTGETTYTFHVEPNDSEKLTQLDEIIKNHYKPLKKDAPFYQGMTKEEVRESVCEFMTSEGDGDRARNKNAHTLKDPSKTEFYCFGHVVVVERGFRKTTELVRIKGCWVVVGFDNPYYKELIQESPTEKKELEEKAVFEEHQHQKHLMEHEAQRKKEESEMKAKAQLHKDDSPEKFGKIGDVAYLKDRAYSSEEPKDWLLGLIREMYPNAKCIWLGESELEPELTAQDLIQAAKDELVDRIIKGSSAAHNEGFAYCINFLEETMGKDPYKN